MDSVTRKEYKHERFFSFFFFLFSFLSFCILWLWNHGKENENKRKEKKNHHHQHLHQHLRISAQTVVENPWVRDNCTIGVDHVSANRKMREKTPTTSTMALLWKIRNNCSKSEHIRSFIHTHTYTKICAHQMIQTKLDESRRTNSIEQNLLEPSEAFQCYSFPVFYSLLRNRKKMMLRQRQGIKTHQHKLKKKPIDSLFYEMLVRYF